MQAAPLGVRQLATAVGRSHSTVSQWTNGHRVPRVADVELLIEHLDLSEVDAARILDLAEAANTPAGDRLVAGVTQAQATIMDAEAGARLITEWSPDLVPGLLQTGDYARVILGNRPVAEVHIPLALRAGRREVLTRAESPPTMVAFVGEDAIRSCIGSPTVRAHQLRHLLKVSELSNVTLRAVLKGHDFHPGLLGPFVIYDFATRPSLVLLEHHRSSAFLYNDEDVRGYKDAAEQIRQRAMSPEDTAQLIAECIE